MHPSKKLYIFDINHHAQVSRERDRERDTERKMTVLQQHLIAGQICSGFLELSSEEYHIFFWPLSNQSLETIRQSPTSKKEVNTNIFIHQRFFNL